MRSCAGCMCWMHSNARLHDGMRDSPVCVRARGRTCRGCGSFILRLSMLVACDPGRGCSHAHRPACHCCMHACLCVLVVTRAVRKYASAMHAGGQRGTPVQQLMCGGRLCGCNRRTRHEGRPPLLQYTPGLGRPTTMCTYRRCHEGRDGQDHGRTVDAPCGALGPNGCTPPRICTRQRL